MKLLELQEKNDEELLDFAVGEGVVEDGATPRRMDILRKMFKAYSEKDETVDADGKYTQNEICVV